jgi:hypothetical protein
LRLEILALSQFGISALVRLGALGLGRISVSLLTGGTIAEAERMIASLAKLPIELRPIVAALWTQPKFLDAVVGQAEAFLKAQLRLLPQEITVTFR